MFEIIKYTSDKKEKWDNFVNKSKNGSFLLNRDFVEYHNDRFIDYSLLIYDRKEKLLAVLPANLHENNLYSHQGLSYGGLVLNKNVKLYSVIFIFKAILEYLHRNQIKLIYYKKIPHFYNEYNSEEDEYIFFRLKANTFRIDTSLTIDYNCILPFQKRREREIKKAKKNNLKLLFDDSFDVFWNTILTPNLLKRFNKKPVHSLEEIIKLKSLFNNNIVQVNVLDENKTVVAGTTLFITGKVIHSQYISTNELGKKLGAIDYLFSELINHYSNDYRYFDFGICNENDGLSINKGLLDWKEGFGARTHLHKFFEIKTSNYNLLND